MNETSIGISDIQLYIPKEKMELENLVEERTRENPRLKRHLERALKVTGQKVIRYPAFWEDTSTIAAAAARRLLKNRDEESLSGLRYLAVGTESGVDHSKPVSAYVEGLLKKSGLKIPESLSSFQVQHACAGGTLALLSVSGLVSQIPQSGDSGVVICSDIARYQTSSTAEVTQGAGAAALLVENNPKLIELDLTTQGYCSKDVDDFFRPNGERYAQVQGRYSMECYIENFESAFLDHCRRRNMEPVQVLDSTDMFILHTPFRNMPEQAMKRLLEKHRGLVNGQTESFLEAKGFYGGIDPVADIGNTYSASMYIDLAFLLKEQYDQYGEDIVGKNILLASYGSGNTMIVIAGKIMPGAPEVIAEWDLDAFFQEAVQTSMIDYTLWTNGPYDGSTYNDLVSKYTIPEDSFYLSKIREDGYREYEFSKQTVDGGTEKETPSHMHRAAQL